MFWKRNLVIWMLALVPFTAHAELSEDQRSELRDSLESWVTRFNQHDAEALADEYAEDADVVLADGQRLRGRQAVHQSFANYFTDHPHVRIRISSPEWRSIGAGLVVEDGHWEEWTASADSQATATESQGRYTTILKHVEGRWLVLHERTFAIEPPLAPLGELAELDWMLGTWEIQATLPDGRKVTGEQTWRLILDQHFLQGVIHITDGDQRQTFARMTVYHDPQTNTIQGMEFWRDGYRGSFTLAEQGLQTHGRGSYANGDTEQFTGRMELSADGKYYRYEAKLTSGYGKTTRLRMEGRRKPEPAP